MAIGTIEGVVKKQVGTQAYFIGTILSDKVKGMTFVPILETGARQSFLNELQAEGGYQRSGSPSRMRLFMKYLQNNENAVIPPVLLAAKDWDFRASDEVSGYGELIVNSPAAIIDGQHRVGGYIALYESKQQIRPIDFVVVVGLELSQEKDVFLTVNNTQKGVTKALSEFLQGTEEAMIAWALNEDDDSPFKDRICRQTMTKSHLFKLNSVAKGVKQTFNHGKLTELDETEKLNILKEYWNIIADELDEEWGDIAELDEGPETTGRRGFTHKLLELTGFLAWSQVAPGILSRCYDDVLGMNWENVRQLVRSCGNLDWRKDGQYDGLTGVVGAQRIKTDMERQIPMAISPDDSE